MVFSEVVGTLSFLQPQSDDDMADRLHYYYTTTFLLVTSVLISLKMFGGRPIECWMPAEYQNSWQEYTEIYCFSMNTYFAPFNKQIPMEQSVRDQNMISYYQWTPFFLVICAFMFYSPCLIWRMLYTKSGIRLNDVVAFATDRSNIQPKQREANIKGVSAHLGSVFKHRFRWGSVRGKDGTAHPFRHKILRLLNLRFYEAYLTLLYIGIKILFLLNVSVQMFIMNWFLQTDAYDYYGWGVLQDLIQGRPWSDSGNFPRVTYCDMDVRILGNVQKHTVQCVLVINIFTEKVFVLLLVWYTFLVVVSLISLGNWLISSIPFEARKKFIARRLELADVEFKRKNFHQELEEFVRDYIKMDGIFVLRMLTIHAGILVCTEIVDEMWEDYVRLNAAKFPKTPGGVSPSAISVEDGKAGKTPGTPSDRQPLLPKRKTSVLVPLVSARRDSTIYPTYLHQTNFDRPSSALPYATTAGLAAASHFLSPQPRSDFHLKTPSAQQWRMGRMRGGRGGPAGGMVRPRNVGRSVGSTLAGVAGAAATLSAIHNAKQQQQQHSYQTPIVIEDNSNESAEDASGQEESGPEERPKEGWLQPPTSHQEGP